MKIIFREFFVKGELGQFEAAEDGSRLGLDAPVGWGMYPEAGSPYYTRCLWVKNTSSPATFPHLVRVSNECTPGQCEKQHENLGLDQGMQMLL